MYLYFSIEVVLSSTHFNMQFTHVSIVNIFGTAIYVTWNLKYLMSMHPTVLYVSDW